MSDITVERIGRTCVITLNHPPSRNALTRPMIRGIREAFDTASGDAGLRAVVLSGSGGSFCAGADLRRIFQDDPDLMDKLDEYMDDFHSIVRAIVRCPKPTIAMIDGAAVGFGADMALACDLRVVSNAAYVQEKFVNIGLMPDGGGTFWLPRLIGTARALRMILLAEKMEAQTLVDLGVAMRMTSPELLREATLEIARTLEKGPPLAFAEIRKALYGSLGDLEDALRREREGQLRLLRSNDVAEGIKAWTQKREPEFHGK